jgi:hypothetical protein
MTHRANCICVTCTVLRERVPHRSEPAYKGMAEPQRGYEAEQGERALFEAWYATQRERMFYDDSTPKERAWDAWRARAIL